MKLTPLIIFIEDKCNPFESVDIQDYYSKRSDVLDSIEKYVHFINQPLNIGMFTPCDVNGVKIDEPEDYDKFLEIEECKLDNPRKIGWSLEECNLGLPKMCRDYHRLKKDVIFKDSDPNIVFNTKGLGYDYYTIYYSKVKDLIKYELSLTSNAIEKWQ